MTTEVFRFATIRPAQPPDEGDGSDNVILLDHGGSDLISALPRPSPRR